MHVTHRLKEEEEEGEAPTLRQASSASRSQWTDSGEPPVGKQPGNHCTNHPGSPQTLNGTSCASCMCNTSMPAPALACERSVQSQHKSAALRPAGRCRRLRKQHRQGHTHHNTPKGHQQHAAVQHQGHGTQHKHTDWQMTAKTFPLQPLISLRLHDSA